MLFRVPHNIVLSTSNSDLKDRISDELGALDPWLSLVLVMIYESGKGPASRWWPYWQILPHEFDTLVFWSPSQLAELQGSAVVSKIGKGDADKAFLESLLPLVIKHAELFGEYASIFKGPHAERVFLTLAHRMASLVMAYAFDIEKEESATEADEDGFISDDEDDPPKGMVPLADMLNANGDRNNVCQL
jgi:SET domain-containing protein 6